MTTFVTARRITRRTWTLLVVLALAALACLAVVLTSGGTDTAAPAPAGVSEVAHSIGSAPIDNCRPSRVVHAC